MNYVPWIVKESWTGCLALHSGQANRLTGGERLSALADFGKRFRVL